MTSVPRDPAFWRRFSIAVHQADVEKQPPGPETPQVKHTDSWLERQKAKRSRRTLICWIFWLLFAGLAAAIVIVLLWLKGNHKLG